MKSLNLIYLSQYYCCDQLLEEFSSKPVSNLAEYYTFNLYYEWVIHFTKDLNSVYLGLVTIV